MTVMQRELHPPSSLAELQGITRRASEDATIPSSRDAPTARQREALCSPQLRAKSVATAAADAFALKVREIIDATANARWRCSPRGVAAPLSIGATQDQPRSADAGAGLSDPGTRVRRSAQVGRSATFWIRASSEGREASRARVEPRLKPGARLRSRMAWPDPQRDRARRRVRVRGTAVSVADSDRPRYHRGALVRAEIFRSGEPSSGAGGEKKSKMRKHPRRGMRSLTTRKRSCARASRAPEQIRPATGNVAPPLSRRREAVVGEGQRAKSLSQALSAARRGQGLGEENDRLRSGKAAPGAAIAPSPSKRGAGIRCAIYTRKSSEEGLEQEFNTLDAQREACEAYVRSQTHEGWTRARRPPTTIGGYSGGTMERPALQALLADIAAEGSMSSWSTRSTA